MISIPPSRYVIDTNFFISGFEKNPKAIEQLLLISTLKGIELHVTSLVVSELRWYLRRRIKKPIHIFTINLKNLRKFRTTLEKRGYTTPSLEDLSNVEAAKELNGTVVTSDLHLLRICEFLDVPVMTSSAFVYYLLSIVDDPAHKEFLYKLYDNILSDEIGYSIQKQQSYDPIVRIKKIQEHAITVIKQLSNRKISAINQEIETVLLLPEEARLIDFINQIEFEFPNYIQLIEEGDYEAIHTELFEIYKELIDLTSELRVALKTKKSLVLDMAVRLKARILFLLCVVEFNILDIALLEKNIDILTELSIIRPELIADLYMDIHFLRMIVFLITENLERLQHYYSEKFILLCENERRDDLIRLTRVVALASTILRSGLFDKRASSPGKDEIALLIQIGYIMLQLEKFEQALLILYQTFYCAIYNEDIQAANDTLNLLIVLHNAINQRDSIELKQAYDAIHKLNSSIFPDIDKHSDNFLNQLETKDFVEVEYLSTHLKDWLYSYGSTTMKEDKNKSRSVLLLINPYINLRIALITKRKFSAHEILPGRQINFYSGKVKVQTVKSEADKQLDVDLLIFVEEDAKILCRGTFGLKLLQ